MPQISKRDVLVPLDVPRRMQRTYVNNYLAATQNSGNLFLFAGDQKIEHLNEDFYGEGISAESAHPRHLFEIASNARIGAFATQLGNIARHGHEYTNVNYIVKLNSKTNLVKTKQEDPISLALNTAGEVAAFRDSSGLNIVGVGYTVYLGSEDEAKMLRQAAEAMFTAHQNGMLGVVWMYPRGAAVPNEKDANLLAGAAGVGVCLGADFIKINPPEDAAQLRQATLAAGNAKVICSGGKRVTQDAFLQGLKAQLAAGTQGCATGRNIHQKPLKEAIAFCEEIAKLVLDAS